MAIWKNEESLRSISFQKICYLARVDDSRLIAATAPLPRARISNTYNRSGYLEWPPAPALPLARGDSSDDADDGGKQGNGDDEWGFKVQSCLPTDADCQIRFFHRSIPLCSKLSPQRKKLQRLLSESVTGFQ